MKRLNECCREWGAGVASLGFSLLIFAAGCHGGQQGGNTTVLERISHAARSKVAAQKPGELAEKGKAAIVTECEKQSYETARKGLIVSETGLREDVFVLRDRVSYMGVGYGLEEAQRLEELLRTEARDAGHPREQANCIEEFAEHLESLSDPLVEADARLKELDASAFTNASKEAQEQADKKLREADRLPEQKAQSPELLPENY